MLERARCGTKEESAASYSTMTKGKGLQVTEIYYYTSYKELQESENYQSKEIIKF